jgi:cell filamentation protein
MADGFGKYEVYAVAASLYCYLDSNVLRNKLNIRDMVQLRSIEADISVVRQTELMENPIKGRFTSNHLCGIHRHLLGDIYSFAGKLRHEDIAKGETRFLAHQEIKIKLQKLLDELDAEKCLVGLEQSQLVARCAYYMAELNYIHPFREGNGRTIREFMRLLFMRNGYLVDSLCDTEKEIQSRINVLRGLVVQSNEKADALNLIQEINKLMIERNAKCKALKR